MRLNVLVTQHDMTMWSWVLACVCGHAQCCDDVGWCYGCWCTCVTIETMMILKCWCDVGVQTAMLALMMVFVLVALMIVLTAMFVWVICMALTHVLCAQLCLCMCECS